MPIKCFWMESAGQQKRFLRRYSSGSKCTGRLGYHDSLTFLDIVSEPRNAEGYVHVTSEELGPVPDHSDARWPKKCECGYEFLPSDNWQVFTDSLYRRLDTGELVGLREAPVGAMWDAKWMPWKGADGRSIVVRLPGNHNWSVDGQASNCTKPNDSEHKCWVRHGEPPNITVDKDGNTCGAGAGSIAVPGYHGFLKGGVLT